MKFDNVYISSRVRSGLEDIVLPQQHKRFWDLITKLQAAQFDIPGLNIEKLHTRKGKIYSARLNIEMRVIFAIDSSSAERNLIVLDVAHHDDAYDRVSRVNLSGDFAVLLGELEKIETLVTPTFEDLQENSTLLKEVSGISLFKIPHYVLANPERFPEFEKNMDRYLLLTEEQKDLIGKFDRAYIVQGSAGTGKTTLALFHALEIYEWHREDDVYLFTYQDELACVCRAYKVNLLGDPASSDEGHKGRLEVFSYLDFCRQYLRRELPSGELSWRWIDKIESLQILKEIISTRPRWQRSIDETVLFGIIYSIFKGRFLPDSESLPKSRDDLLRIFRDYGQTPDNLDDLLEVFALYEERLKRTGAKDEADLIRFCYETLKNKGVVTESPYATWIVIDEIQDFTELEWKSILLFWENKCKQTRGLTSFPFLSGDRNQNISRSGFRWQEVEKYLSGILAQEHRANLLTRVHLHQNFRNTKEIFHLGSFLRSFGSIAYSDLGLAPTLTGPLPELVIGKEEDFHAFINDLASLGETESSPPGVVLCEDESLLAFVQSCQHDPEAIFVLPLQKSKGMEFEDVIIFRLFSSASAADNLDKQTLLEERFFDLWYMAVTRARRRLLIYLTPEDYELAKGIFTNRFTEFQSFFSHNHGEPAISLRSFFDTREKLIPNYNVIFLENRIAEQLWNTAKETKNTAETSKQKRDRQRALKLWTRTRNYPALGQAYYDLAEYGLSAENYLLAGLLDKAAFSFKADNEFQKAANNFKESGLFVEAAECYVNINEYGEAADCFKRCGNIKEAAHNYSLAGSYQQAAACFEETGQFTEAAYQYRLLGEYVKSAVLYERAQLHEQAAQMYLKVKDRLDAARAFMKAGKYERAARLFEALKRWAEAAEAWQHFGNFDLAGKYFLKAGEQLQAADCFAKLEEPDKAGSIYLRAGKWEKAAECFRQSGNLPDLIESLIKLEQWQEALKLLADSAADERTALCLKKIGKFVEAAEIYDCLDRNNDAAFCYERAGHLAQAASRYMSVENFAAAGAAYLQVGNRLESAKAFLLSGQFTTAMEIANCVPTGGPRIRAGDLSENLIGWCEQSNRQVIAAQIYEFRGDMARAADKYKLCLQFHKAAECLEKNRQPAAAADLYLKSGDFESAVNCYKRSKQMKNAARCLEMLKRWQEAMDIYEQLNDAESIERCRLASTWL